MSAPDLHLSEGRYQLLEPIGSGGMATVYRAYDTRLQVHRAIKILAPEFSNKPKVRARFEAEARTMAILDHANIVRVYDVGTDGTQVWIVMEIVEGTSLLERIDHTGPMGAETALKVTSDVLLGLIAAHKQGVVHRDIKPHNILLSLEGRGRITDFGIARSMNLTEDSFTKTGAVMGTWAFMAPEQRVDAKGVDHTADLYGMGATLFSMVTQRTPMDLFAADLDPEMLVDVPDLLRPLIRRSTKYQRQERYVDAQEMLDAVRACQARLGRDDLPLRTPVPPTVKLMPPASTPSGRRANKTYVAEPSMRVPPARPPGLTLSAPLARQSVHPAPPMPPLPVSRPFPKAQPFDTESSITDTLLPAHELVGDDESPATNVTKERDKTDDLDKALSSGSAAQANPNNRASLLVLAVIVLMIITGIALRVFREKPAPVVSQSPSPAEASVDQVVDEPGAREPIDEPTPAPVIEIAQLTQPSARPASPSTEVRSPPTAPSPTPVPSATPSEIRIWHSPVTNGRLGDTLRFSVNIRGIEPQDYRNYNVHIAYRTVGATAFTQMSMQRTSMVWKAFLQVTPQMQDGLEYIIVAKPDLAQLPNRTKLFSGRPQTPHRVRIATN